MIYTKTGEYAIRAILFLARQSKDRLVMSSEIAKSEDIPSHYLAKILQRMAKYGYVDSFKGRGGGFRITELAKKSSILEIVERVEGPVINLKCVTGLKECSEENPCPLHDEWEELRNRIYNLISSKSVQEVAEKYAETLSKNTSRQK
ncbi:RrF2 family transcriptional regulator [Melioribacter sp. OK-6-Me]|uniref:RrF2 family transcriptional regulator n=1 Tax=unclassified Melioribacter TaxID=2627329 RepID=UPI003ED96E4B